METALWLTLGVLLIGMALSASSVKRLPLTTSAVYLVAGVALGPYGFSLLTLDLEKDAALVEVITEVAILLSLFTAGLRLRTHLSHKQWVLPLRLALFSMVITVTLITLIGYYYFSLPLGGAILLGAILSPTDPVLASDVQIQDPDDKDTLRFSLTGEAGLNDSSAFPFIMLGLGLLELRSLGSFGSLWFLRDVVWATGAGLGIGWFLGVVIGYSILYLRREHKESVGLDDLLALGLIALSYGLALSVDAYGFLAVFAAGLSLRNIEMKSTGHKPAKEIIQLAKEGKEEEISVHPDNAPAYMVESILTFNQQLERIGEVGVVLILGAILSFKTVSVDALWFIPVFFLIIRPVAVRIGLLFSKTSSLQMVLISWFGIRGVGSLYYLTYAITHETPRSIWLPIANLTIVTVAASIIVHGISVTPLMNYYQRRVTQRTHGLS